MLLGRQAESYICGKYSGKLEESTYPKNICHIGEKMTGETVEVRSYKWKAKMVADGNRICQADWAAGRGGKGGGGAGVNNLIILAASPVND